MKNLYKNTDIFRCIHESHRDYKNKISVYHILKEKSCFPHGCVYFRWKCKQLSKKSKCHRGYSFVGRKCPSCKDYYEEKIHNYPELQISKLEFENFKKELVEFEDWIEEHQLKPIEFAGTVAEIKPHFRQKIYPKSKFLSFQGYIAVLTPVFLGWERFEDPVYASISAKYLQKLHLFSRDVRLHLVTAALIGFTMNGIWAVLFNLYLLRLGYTPEFIGLVHAVSMFVFAMFCLPAGALGTKWGSRRMLIISVLMITVGNGLLPLVELITETEMALDELIDITGRAADILRLERFLKRRGLIVYRISFRGQEVVHGQQLLGLPLRRRKK